MSTLTQIKNTNRKFGANPFYFALEVDGNYYFFTGNQLKVAKRRAMKNYEDKPRSWWQKLIY